MSSQPAASHPAHRCHLLRRENALAQNNSTNGCWVAVAPKLRGLQTHPLSDVDQCSCRLSAPFCEAALRWNQCSPFQSLHSPPGQMRAIPPTGACSVSEESSVWGRTKGSAPGEEHGEGGQEGPWEAAVSELLAAQAGRGHTEPKESVSVGRMCP